MACEPTGSPGWYPVNDEPADKATFDFAVTVPKGLTVLCQRRPPVAQDGRRQNDVALERDRPDGAVPRDGHAGRFDLTEYEIDGIPTYVAVDPSLPKGQVLAKLPAIVRFFIDLYGAYPFNAAGAIVDNAKFVGYALETQTKPIFDRMPDEWTLVHETAHMWYGDRDPHRLARHLAERGVRHMVQLDLERAAGEQDRSPAVQAVLQHARQGGSGAGDRATRRA